MIYKQYRYIKVGGGNVAMNSCGDFKSQVIRIRSAVNNLISTMRFQTVGPAVPQGGWLGTTPAHACMDMCINHVWLYNPVCVHACQNPPSVNNSFIPPSTYVRIYVRTSLV